MTDLTEPVAYRNSTVTTFPSYEEAEKDWISSDVTQGMISFIAPLPLWENEKSFCLTLPLPADQPKSNLVVDRHLLSLCNVRGREDAFSLDKHGFCFRDLPPIDVDLADKGRVETEYVHQMETFLRTELNAESVHVFDYTIRRVKPPGNKYKWNEPRPPGTDAHTDQSPHAAQTRLQLHLGIAPETLQNRRVQFLNVWRPIVGPVTDLALAVCDARTVEHEDLLAHDLVYPHYVGENFQVKYNEKQHWYFLDAMEPNECLIFKNFDSLVDGRSRLCPHAAFKRLPEIEAIPRQSIEVRAMVFYGLDS